MILNFIVEEKVNTKIGEYETLRNRVCLNPFDLNLIYTNCLKERLVWQGLLLFQIDFVLVPGDYMENFKEMCKDLGITLFTEHQAENPA